MVKTTNQLVSGVAREQPENEDYMSRDSPGL
jgi:hypothetical protein